ncbi:hypothetical protein [Leptolyngbya ohadii]|uniref:hypothetical protein n=1 Tax=Leptolyngbya ohadii TaxID=1962290 RepID=UPI003F6F8C6A
MNREVGGASFSRHIIGDAIGASFRGYLAVARAARVESGTPAAGRFRDTSQGHDA